MEVFIRYNRLTRVNRAHRSQRKPTLNPLAYQYALYESDVSNIIVITGFQFKFSHGQLGQR